MFVGMAFFLVVVTVVPEPELGGDDEGDEDTTEGVRVRPTGRRR